MHPLNRENGLINSELGKEPVNPVNGSVRKQVATILVYIPVKPVVKKTAFDFCAIKLLKKIHQLVSHLQGREMDNETMDISN